jgi:hypothetical protein
MRASLVTILFLLVSFLVLAQEASVKTSVVEEEMEVRSALPNQMSEAESKTSVLAEEDEEEIINVASQDSGQGGALSLGQENEEERSVSTNPLTYYGYKEASSEVYDEIYNYYSLSYSKKLREWQ